jgi:hypothetical protein
LFEPVVASPRLTNWLTGEPLSFCDPGSPEPPEGQDETSCVFTARSVS